MRDVSVPCVTTPVAGDVIKPQRSSGKEGGGYHLGEEGVRWGVGSDWDYGGGLYFFSLFPAA